MKRLAKIYGNLKKQKKEERKRRVALNHSMEKRQNVLYKLCLKNLNVIPLMFTKSA
jgi:hypothetical protein